MLGFLDTSKSRISPSRTYVVLLNRANFEGFFWKRFTLPEDVENNTEFATWYFYNVLDAQSCGYSCLTWEEYQDVQGVEPKKEKTNLSMIHELLKRFRSSNADVDLRLFASLSINGQLIITFRALKMSENGAHKVFNKAYIINEIDMLNVDFVNVLFCEMENEISKAMENTK